MSFLTTQKQLVFVADVIVDRASRDFPRTGGKNDCGATSNYITSGIDTRP